MNREINQAVKHIHAGIKLLIEKLTRAQGISLLIGFGWAMEDAMTTEVGPALMTELEFSSDFSHEETATAIINLLTVALILANQLKTNTGDRS